MANINQYLTEILEAVYGEEVRSSIYNAIDIINKVGEKVLTIGTDVTSVISSTSGYYDGSLYLNSNTYDLWKCNGTGWDNEGNVKGSAGISIESIIKQSTIGLVDTYQVVSSAGTQLGSFTVTNANKIVVGNAVTATNTSVTIDDITYVEDDLYINNNTWIVWKCTGTGWINTGTITGEQGEQGEQGPRGLSIAQVSKFETSGIVDTYNVIDEAGGIIGTFDVTNGAKGDPGTNGVTPTITVSKTGKDTTLVVYDGVNGSRTYHIYDGADGEGSGNMNTSVYDQNLNGIVDAVDRLDGATATFTEAQSRTNIATGETSETLFGKIKKWFTDLKDVAFSGSYGDLIDKPTNMTGATSSNPGTNGFIPAPAAGDENKFFKGDGTWGETFPVAVHGNVNGDNIIAIGDGITYGTAGSTALGTASTAVNNSTAIGYSANASGSQSTALGQGANANGAGSIALGYSANANGTGSTALGYSANANGAGSIALGYLSNANGSQSTALGRSSNAIGSYSTALGHLSKANGTGSTALGYSANASGNQSTALGYSANASGNQSTALGYSAKANEEASIAIGYLSNANGSYSTALGHLSKANGTGSTALGYLSNASGSYSTALGQGSSANGSQSTALGFGANTSDAESDTIRLGSSIGLGALKCRVSLTVTSDERDKTDFDSVTNALEFINALDPITYVNNERSKYAYDEEILSDEDKEIYNKFGVLFSGGYDHDAHKKGIKKGKRRRVGLKAQQIQNVMKEIYGTSSYANLVDDVLYDIESIPENVEGQLSVSYERFVPFLIGAIKELTKRIEELENEKN